MREVIKAYSSSIMLTPGRCLFLVNRKCLKEILNPEKHAKVGSWGGSSISKMLAMQARGHKFNSQHPCEKLGKVAFGEVESGRSEICL